MPYKIQVTTTKKPRAGTDANVHIKIYGTKSTTEKIPLIKSKTHKNPFESGNIDVFEMDLPKLGQIEKIK